MRAKRRLRRRSSERKRTRPNSRNIAPRTRPRPRSTAGSATSRPNWRRSAPRFSTRCWSSSAMSRPWQRPRRAERLAMGCIVVGGALAQRPGYGGHAWALLNYLQGFRALGHEVLLLDRLTPEMAPEPARRKQCVNWLVEVMEGAGLDGSYSLFLGEETVGLSRQVALERV